MGSASSASSSLQTSVDDFVKSLDAELAELRKTSEAQRSRQMKASMYTMAPHTGSAAGEEMTGLGLHVSEVSRK